MWGWNFREYVLKIEPRRWPVSRFITTIDREMVETQFKDRASSLARWCLEDWNLLFSLLLSLDSNEPGKILRPCMHVSRALVSLP